MRASAVSAVISSSTTLPPSTTAVALNSPLVLYRSLVETQRIAPDPAQHRLALRLQSLHERLLGYEPVGARWEELRRAASSYNHGTNKSEGSEAPKLYRGTSAVMKKFWRSWFLEGRTAQKDEEMKDLVRHLSSAEEAVKIDAPKGLLVHGSVGSGKSMLMDMLLLQGAGRWAAKGARWHYGEFMLHVVRSLSLHVPPPRDQQKEEIENNGMPYSLRESDSIVSLACDLINRSPLLMIDEFQLPDRMAAKTLSNLLTVFFRLGGVLVATSNRLPDELAKAAGREYASAGEFAGFVELLKAKCEIWEMDGFRDYRRLIIQEGEVKEIYENEENNKLPRNYIVTGETDITDSNDIERRIQSNLMQGRGPEDNLQEIGEAKERLSASLRDANIPWQESNIIVYGRSVSIPKSFNGISYWTFDQLCATRLGPADYISLASEYHTFIITDIPILTSSLKNEARRFITAIDALYEAGCKLFITAEASPDNLFFPDEKLDIKQEENEDAIHAETFAEMHQDVTTPFRPNISSYAHRQPRRDDAMEDEPPGRIRKAALSHLSEMERLQLIDNLLDFKRTESFVGEDELFAYRRAVSRIWEMCSAKWWAKDNLWKPISKDSRHWETKSAVQQTKQLTSTSGDNIFQTSWDIAPRFNGEHHAYGIVMRGREYQMKREQVEGAKES